MARDKQKPPLLSESNDSLLELLRWIKIGVPTDDKIGPDADTRLMLLVADGNSSVFTKLYNKYFLIVSSRIASLNKHSASPEDLAQEVFSRVWENREKYRPDSSVKTFLFGYARNVLMEEENRLAKTTITSQKQLLERRLAASCEPSGPETEVCQAESVKALKQAVIRLTVDQRQAIRLVYDEEMSLQEAAQHANCSIRALEGRLHRARERLRQLVRDIRPQET